MNEDNGDEIFFWLNWLVWIGIILAFIAIACLVAWGLCATAAALDHGETWAQWVAGILFLVACVIMLREIREK